MVLIMVSGQNRGHHAITKGHHLRRRFRSVPGSGRHRPRLVHCEPAHVRSPRRRHRRRGVLLHQAQRRKESGVTMLLKIKRSQRSGGILGGTVIFGLNVRAEYSPEEKTDINKYKLGGAEVFYNNPSEALSFKVQITVKSLQDGHQIDCKSAPELIHAEDEIMKTCQNLQALLKLAATFDGREVVVDFSGPEPVVN